MSYKGEVRPLRTLSPRPELIVDQWGNRLVDPTDYSIVGISGPLGGERIVWALPTNTTGGALSLRYHPPHHSEEVCTFGMNFDNVIPLGIGISSGTLQIQTNVVPPVDVTNAWIIDPIQVRNRALYATVNGGVTGTDYIFTWFATDTNGLIWPRSALVLCAPTS
jgi:hypothetical protein